MPQNLHECDDFTGRGGSGSVILPRMSAELSPFSRWALDDARTADERYTIWLLCESTRLQEHWLLSRENPGRIYRSTPHHYFKELFLNPGLIPAFTERDTETAAAMIPHLKKFPHILPIGHESRPIRDAGALRFFPALESVSLSISEVRDISFLEALPLLTAFSLHTGELDDLSPLRHCRGLRELSLGLSGTGYPAFAPPLHWVDASPLAALTALESLNYYPNAAVLEGLAFPALKTASLGTGSTVQPDCRFLPDMPAVRHLRLDGVQSLRGISRFPALRSLDISGPLRDWGDVAALPRLMCMEVSTGFGWPRDVTPLAAAPELRWICFAGEMPRNYWPLTAAPKLCEIEAPQSKTIQIEVQAINAALTPWDQIFATVPPRAVPPLRFVAADSRVIPRMPDTPHQDFVDSPVLFLRELWWMDRKAHGMVSRMLGDDDWRGSRSRPSGSNNQRSLHFAVATQAAADRLPEIIETLRQAMATSAHDWDFHFGIHLKVPRHQWGPERWRWFKEISSQWEDEDEEGSHERWKLTQQHVIESNFRKRTAEAEGEEPDPDDLTPPQQIRPEAYLHTVPAVGDPDEEKEKDFALKPFDEQEQNDDDDDDDSSVKTKEDEPPDWFLEDMDGHPLAESYRLYGMLTLDTFYIWPNLAATAESLMQRPVDETLPGP